jgi:alanine racemase
MNTASSILKIDTKNLRENYKFLDALSKPARATAVVKANGYGLGIETVIRALDPEHPPLYFVATVNEGIECRRHTNTKIAILNGLFKGAEEEYKAHNLIPVCGSLNDIHRANAHDLTAIWQIDTGMNRLGVRHDEIESLYNLPEPFMILSHFISSEDSNDSNNQIQIDRFEKIYNNLKILYPNALFSLSNSSGIFLTQKPNYDITRTGIALYGSNPTPDRPNPMKAVAHFSTRILRIDHARQHETAGYNATYQFKKDSKLATVSLGYADGIPRYATHKLNLVWQGCLCPVRGRISMDTMIVDITDLPSSVPSPQIGDFMDLICEAQTVDDVANSIGTIGYEILTSLSMRATRFSI